MATEQELEQIELSISQAKLSTDNLHALNRLTKNKDFEQLILEGYFKEEASRLVLIKAEPQMESESDQATIAKHIDAIGYFRQYLHTIQQIGRMAERAIADDEKTREEMLAED